MTGFVVRRLLLLCPTLLGVTLIAFLIIHGMPGDPAEILAGEHASPEVVAQIRHELRLDLPLPEQYVRYLADVLRGDLGRSAKTHESVAVEIRRFFPATVELSVAALFVACLVGIPAGFAAARRPGGLVDAVSTGVASLGVSMPVFWLGLLLMYLLGVHLAVLPVSGRTPAVWGLPSRTGFLLVDSLLARDPARFLDVVRHLTLPAFVLGTVPMAVIARITRSSLVDAMACDYVRAARARGLSTTGVLVRHALPNGILPTLTVIGLQFGTLLGGAIITETIFSWPGIGRWVLLAVEARDARVLQAGVLLMATSFSLVNLLTDVAYARLDPRIRVS